MNRLETLSPPPRIAYALLVVATAIWGSGMVIGRGVHDDIPPIGLGFWRVMVAVLLLLPLVLPELARLAPVLRRHWRFLTILGIFQIWPQAVVLVALNYTTAVNATLINSAQPALTATLTAILFRDRVSAGQAVGIALALAGIGVMVSRGDWQVIASLDFNIGDWLVVGAILFWALYAINLPRLPSEIGLTTTLFLVSFTGGLTMLPFYLYEAVFIRPTVPDGVTIVTVLWMGVMISTASIFIWNMCLRALGPHRTTIFINLNPVWAALFAVIFLGEEIYLYHLIGALFVCGGITLMIRMARRGVQIEPTVKVEA